MRKEFLNTSGGSFVFFMLIVIISMMFITNTLLAQTTGRVIGQISDAQTGDFLPGANILIIGTSFGSASDRAGMYRIDNVLPGKYTLTFSYIGYKDFSTEIEVISGETITQDAALAVNYIETDEIVVEGLRQGQAKALSQQRSSDHIMNVVSSELIEQFPDPNAAEALQRIPGISITRDHGEGRYALIRGTEARLNSTMINGQRIPSPEDDNRNVSLDVIPSNLFNSIEVSKALTPDMDGDAIGGAVNLITKNAFDFEGQVLNFNVSGAYRNLRGDGGGRAAFTYGDQFMDNKLGVLFSGSYENNDMGTDNIETEWADSYERVTDVRDYEASSELDDGDWEIDDGDTTWVYETDETEDVTALDKMELRHYNLNRQRLGVTGNFDYKLSDQSSFFVRTVYNLYTDEEWRNALVFDYGGSVDDEEPGTGYTSANSVLTAPIERELKYRTSKSTIFSIFAGGKHNFSNFDMDYNFSSSFAEEKRDPSRTYVFVSEENDLTYNFSDPNYPKIDQRSKDFNDPSNFEFDKMELLDGQSTIDKDFTAAVNFKVPFNFGSVAASFKFGGKYSSKEKDSDKSKETEWSWEGEENLELSDLTTDIDGDDLLDGNYDHSIGIGDEKMDNFWKANLDSFESEPNLEANHFETWDATEKITAFYGMFDLNFSDIKVIAGARAEMSDIEYNGSVGNKDDEASIHDTTGTNDYTNVLPMIHLNYNWKRKLVLRAAYTNSLARPNYFDLVPFQMTDDEDLILGNPSLKPTLSTNIDIMAEYYLGSLGIISCGYFHKTLTDYIYIKTTEENLPAGIDKQIQPVNGEDATLSGVELSWQQQLTFLPGALNGLGIYLNYTYTTSEANIGREKSITLPGQADNVGNFSLSYEKYGFTTRLSVNVHGKYIDEVGESEDEDIYYNDHTQVDLSANYKVTDKIVVFADFLNLTNEPLMYYMGSTSRPIQRELYSVNARFGAKYEF
jgi:TonB-dependent receptor